jgi:hypothetical protein
VDFSKLSREDWMVGGGGVVLIISLLVFDWYSVGGVSASSGITVGGYSAAAVSSPYAIWGVLALIVAIIMVADLALARFSPQTQIPTTKLGRDLTRAAAGGLLMLLLAIKFIAHVGNFGFGFVMDVIFAIVVAAGAWLIAQGNSAAIGSNS